MSISSLVVNHVTALVPAAGQGRRMGVPTPKQFLTLGGHPLMVHALQTLQRTHNVDAIILAVPESVRDWVLHDIVERHGLTKVRQVIAGGTERQDSVRLALAATTDDCEVVLVHDAVRPFVTSAMVISAIEQARRHGAAIVAIPMRDTVKYVGSEGFIEYKIDRRPLWLAQTPQAFQRALLMEGHARALAEGFTATDDAQLIERLGHRLAIVEGSSENLKITRPEDLAMGESILASRQDVQHLN